MKLKCIVPAMIVVFAASPLVTGPIASWATPALARQAPLTVLRYE